MQPLSVVEFEVTVQTVNRHFDRFVIPDVNLFVLHRSPKPFDKDVVQRSTASIHADQESSTLEPTGELRTRELRALIAVEDLGLARPQRPLQRRHAELRMQRTRNLPAQHVSAEPIQDRY